MLSDLSVSNEVQFVNAGDTKNTESCNMDNMVQRCLVELAVTTI